MTACWRGQRGGEGVDVSARMCPVSAVDKYECRKYDKSAKLNGE